MGQMNESEPLNYKNLLGCFIAIKMELLCY